VQFSWPLALRELTMGLSRPLINLWVARGERGTEELAVLIIVFPFIHVACECLAPAQPLRKRVGSLCLSFSLPELSAGPDETWPLLLSLLALPNPILR